MIEKQISEAERCLNCIKKPCMKNCPLDNDIPKFISYIKEKEYKKAYEVLSETTVLMRICGRICPKHRQCQSKCTKKYTDKPIEIGNLESMIGDFAHNNNWKISSPKETKYNVAIVGAGPAGLTCAAFLRKNGIGVTIYEKHDYLGGLLIHGIPEFRLKKEIVNEVIDEIINLGIDVKYNMELGKNIKIDTLIENHDAIFISVGANLSNKMNIEGENLEGVYGANEILENNTNIDFENKTVAIIGGGDVAVDIARTIKRKKPNKIKIIYRRKKEEMPTGEDEINIVQEEGIEILPQTNLIKIEGEKKVEKIELIKTENEEGTVQNISDTNYKESCDIVVMAIGSHQDSSIDNVKVEKTSNGKIKIDSYGKTSNEKIFAGGDITETIKTVAWASKSGRKAAYSIIKYLKESSQEEFIEPLFY